MLLKESAPSPLHPVSSNVITPHSEPKDAIDFLNPHHQQVFGEFAGQIDVGINPKATLAVINPRLQCVDFGTFRVPSLREVLSAPSFRLMQVMKVWARMSRFSEDAKPAFVPPETGRAILLPPSSHKIFRDLLIKGTGIVERFTRDNKLRYESRGFDGVLELSEAERDLIHSDILERAGVLVAPGVGIVDHHMVQQYPDFTAWIGNYIRAFRVQTRISNLFELSPPTRRAAIDDAINRVSFLTENSKRLSYPEYFDFILRLAAKNVAIMQAIGFTQESFHFGQVTLCGELVDFGVGNFKRPQRRGQINSMYPWFRYERQPILMLNMLYKTHAVKAEPYPVRLDKNSSAMIHQKTLFGAIRSFAPEAAMAIERMDPQTTFWRTYEETYSSFNSQAFNQEVVAKIKQDYFSWNIEPDLQLFPKHLREMIRDRYLNRLARVHEHFENQIETWERLGPSAIHQKILFFKALQGITETAPFGLTDGIHQLWPTMNPDQYMEKTKSFENPVEDLSWKPNLKNC